MSRTARVGLTELYAPPDDTAVIAHIIAVHGLYGDAFKTWEWNSPELQSKPKTGRQSSSASTENATKTILWLRDLLPTALPNTRIFTFGYNAQLNTFDTVNGLIDLAHDLLANLEAKRRNLKEENVPIIFIAHSLGGLIVKEALVVSVRQAAPRKNIAQATWGIIFLGTPHRGSRHSSVSTTILRMTKLLVPQRKDLIGILESQSKPLSELNDQFRFLLSNNNINILSVFETLLTPVVGLVVDRDSTTLGYEREQVSPIHANHWDLAKFASKADDGFKTLEYVLLGWTKTISSSLPACDSAFGGLSDGSIDLLDADAILRNLSYPELEMREDSIELPHQNSYGWLFNGSSCDLMEWVNSRTSNILWISGKPGSGKSTIIKLLVNRSKEPDGIMNNSTHTKTTTVTTIGFFFNSRGSRLEKSISGMLRSILSQILVRARQFLPLIQLSFSRLVRAQRSNSPSWGVHTLVSTLQAIMNEDKIRVQFRLFIDALDECEDDMEDLISIIQLLGRKTSYSDQTRMSICVSSRSSISFDDRFGHSFRINLADHVSADLERYVRDRLCMVAAHYSSSRLVEAVIHKADGMFMWAKLAVQEIIIGYEDGGTEAELLENLSTTPTGLMGLFFWQMLLNVPEAYRKQSQIMMQLAVNHSDTFTLEEFVNLTDFINGSAGVDERRDAFPRPAELREKYLESRSGGLLEAVPFASQPSDDASNGRTQMIENWLDIQSQRLRVTDHQPLSELDLQPHNPSILGVRFIHSSVREALEMDFAGHGCRHLELLHCVLAYGRTWAKGMRSKIFRLAQLADQQVSNERESRVYVSVLKILISMGNATTTEIGSEPATTRENLLLGDLISDELSGLQTHFQEYLPDNPEAWLFVLAVAGNLCNYVREEFKANARHWSDPTTTPSLLRIAAVGERLTPESDDRGEMVRLLLELGVDVNERACDTLLCQLDHVAIDPDLDCTTLSWILAGEAPPTISEMTRESLENLLLEHGARVDIADLPPRYGGLNIADYAEVAPLTSNLSTITASTLRTLPNAPVYNVPTTPSPFHLKRKASRSPSPRNEKSSESTNAHVALPTRARMQARTPSDGIDETKLLLGVMVDTKRQPLTGVASWEKSLAKAKSSATKSRQSDISSPDSDVSMLSSESESEDGLTPESLENHNRLQHLGAIVQDRTEAVIAPLKEELINRIIHEMSKNVEDYFASILGSSEQGGKTLVNETTSTGTQSRSGFTNSTPTATASSSSRKRPVDDADPGEENNEDPDEHGGRKKQKGDLPPKDNIPKLTYACHFYKRMPLVYHGPFGTRWHSCGSSYKEVYRIKEHITKRAHKVPFSCPICYTEFPNQAAKDKHIQDSNQSLQHTQSPKPPFDGSITEEQLALLPKRPRSKEAATPESEYAYWYEIWDILFPGEQRPEDPYFVDLVTFVRGGDAGCPGYQSLAGFVRYWRANHIEIARPIIMASMGQGQPVQSILMESFMPMMSRVFDTALRTYFRESGPNQEFDMSAEPNFDLDQFLNGGPWV